LRVRGGRRLPPAAAVARAIIEYAAADSSAPPRTDFRHQSAEPSLVAALRPDVHASLRSGTDQLDQHLRVFLPKGS